MQPYQCLQLIKYVGLCGTLPYVTDLLLPLARYGICSSCWYVWLSGLELRFLCKGDVLGPTLQTLHLNFFKETLGHLGFTRCEAVCAKLGCTS